MLRDAASITSTHRRILLATTLGWIFDFYDFVLFTYLMIPMSQQLHFTTNQTAEAIALSLMFTGLGGIFFGFVADKIGRKPTLMITITLYSIGGILMMFTQTYGWMIFARAVTGFGVGGEWGVGQSLLAETVPAKLRGRFGAVMHSGLSVGIILAYIIGAFVAPHLGWRLTFGTAVIALLIVLPVLAGVPESDVWKNREVGKVARVPLRLIFQGKTPWYALAALILMTLEFTGYWLLTTWFPTYMQTQRHMTIGHSALWLILLNVGGFLGYTSTGFIADRFGRRKVLAVYKIIEAAAVVPITLFWTGNTAVLLICMFFIGFGGGGTAVVGPIFSEVFPGPVRSTVSNSVFNIGRGLTFFMPLVVAALATTVGFGTLLSTASIFFVVMAILVWVFPETRGKVLTD
ncbi:MFS transporter [Alicyclobacillus cycloheptanicus]|uniref:MFS family permease n=1 Tax=Alicyclobacillus cycloheptanicus TaxID=1457 RepID=A0ABT9XEZ0_9BACL|nr:MFS transporter [Alicyclobacillus cycloheptanicus]MDQ0188864.1 MFS family permease [Alicyclobacillus cycloheptanicus]WDM00493.1 MFS transporter [Alicyclobacillus cycloheptanicus]